MSKSFVNLFGHYLGTVSRRDLFRTGGLMALPAWLRNAAAAPAPASVSPGLKLGPDIYESIGIRPIINCRGTFTVVGGSLELPEVRAAKEAAAQHFVQLDEMMEAVGARLAELTGAEWGVVTSGCAAALAHATAACVAGGNPDRHVRIPDLTGFPKDEVVIPQHSRNVYDAAVRSVGVRIVEVGTTEELEAALGPRVAMVYVLAGPRADAGPPSFADVVRLAKPRHIPVLVDAAAEMLSIPNIHLQRGATMVGYSGGKCIRGPQCAGLLLGRKDLIQAAWVHSAPHHGYGRSMKVGKEEAMGMLIAVEMWVKRDHEADDRLWMSWMEHIAARLSAIDGVTAIVREPRGLGNHSPGLSIRWDTDKIGISGEQVSHTLFTTEPRITLAGSGGFGRGNPSASPTETGVSILAYMMQPGDEKIVAERLHAVLSAAPRTKLVKETKAPATDLSGQWDVHIDFAAGSSIHTLFLRQNGERLEGTHQGDYIARDLSGAISGNSVEMHSHVGEQHGAALNFKFSGMVTGDSMSGELDMDEYLKAKWSATRHAFGRAGRQG
jgi:L-seryl-tRNA(Ser) seleniumtransferase